MITVPNPDSYTDPVRYLRDCHVVILHSLKRLEELATTVNTGHLLESLQTEGDWQEILEFFERFGPVHELMEAEAIFNVLERKLPHLGFQPPTNAFRFLIEGHEVLVRKTHDAVERWRAILMGPPEEVSAQESKFLEAVREMIDLYREHISIEESQAYQNADLHLSASEKRHGMEVIQEHSTRNLNMPALGFDTPTAMAMLPTSEFLIGEGSEAFEVVAHSQIDSSESDLGEE